MKVMIRFLKLMALVTLASCANTTRDRSNLMESIELSDASRERKIPIALYFPGRQHGCARARRCPVAFVSPGYGLSHTDYSFVANALAGYGYLVVSIQHDLPSDPPLSRTGNLFASRMPAWERGAHNLRFVRDSLSHSYRAFDWTQLVLIGHSNGGDISAFALHQSPALATTLITLDNRRYPIPRGDFIKVLSIRASDFEADAGVLPTDQEKDAGACITAIAGARHNDMNDHGPAELKSKISMLIVQFLKDGQCEVQQITSDFAQPVSR